MKKLAFLFIFIGGVLGVYSQDTLLEQSKPSDTILDNKYREDQFYIGVTYNLLNNKPSGVAQSGFSSGFHAGFIRDIPINKRRNVGLGVGLGVSTNSFNNNFLITSGEGGELQYVVLDKNLVGYTKNKFTTYMLEVPLQLRWRTSTATDYKFWRIYTGFNLGYVFYNSSKFKGDLGTIKNKNIQSFNDFQYGLTISAGYNTWNIYVYYGLNTIFSEAYLESELVDMQALKVGLIFYIL
ncbi:porin family protein [Bizionia sediminis]|uniref:Porin family protein n=1 Tax=Bizionia sediminis TaxID=1737064 RepID=A0ABW5KUX1_9FLAO